MINTLGRVFLLVIISSALIYSVRAVSAQELSVSGNGAGSVNQLNIQNNNSVSIKQGGSVQINNNNSAQSDTGGNSVTGNTGGGNQIKSGNATSQSNTQNLFNINQAETGKCCATPTPVVSPKPTATPPSGGGGGQGGGGGGNSNSSGGSGSGGGDGGSSKTAPVLGLSATDGQETEQYLFYSVGLLCLSLGGKFLLSKNFIS